jgi:hypothetical protein
MKKAQYIISLTIISLFISCNINTNTPKCFNTKYIQTEQGVPYFQSDSFVSNPFEFPIDPEVFENYYPDYSDKSVELIKNIHDPSITDKLMSYSKDESTIKFYLASGKIMLSVFDIEDEMLEMAGDIHVGLTKHNFLNIFGIGSLQNDTCDIGNLEGTNKFRFFFAKNELIRIKYFGYID